MNVSCPSCETVYRVDPAKVPAGGVRARCAVCSSVFAVGNAAGTPAAAPQPVMAASGPAAAAPVFTPATTAPRTPPAPPPPPPMPPAAAPPARRPTPAPPATPPRPPLAPPVGAPVRPVAAPPVAAPATRAAPPAAPMAAPAAPPRPARAPAAAAPAAAPPAAAPPVAPAAAVAGGPPLQRKTGPLRAVNPFLVQDPKQKARRLARALISDMIVYHPEKRQNGLRDGTLPQLFKDEIEKSWLEYVEQVGRDLAESTPFWTEALNEILAGGKKVF